MKFFALLLATSGLVCAQQLVTGQAARVVIGKQTFSDQTGGASPTLLGAVGGVAYAKDTLVIVDSNRIQATPINNRVMVYNNISGKLPPPRKPIPASGERCPLCGATADLVLGQPDFGKTDPGKGRDKLRTPSAVATDGTVLAVADTDNNRVLIWSSMPTTTNQPPDVVVGQANFDGSGINYGGSGFTPSAQGLRGPQGVWIQDGRLFVADTQNHRVLIWNRIPTQSGAAADLVLGAPNMTTFVETDLTRREVKAEATNLLNPVSVTSDGQRLYVADLGHNRVLIWNRIPTQNAEPADVAVGQPNVRTSVTQNAETANNSQELCRPSIIDGDNRIYPARCAATLNFPRFALSDGERLFIADGGNDRILVFNSIPTENGQAADAILGQLNEFLAQDSLPMRIAAADTVRTPTALAWDGVNLYVTDPYNRRVMVWTPADQQLPGTGVRNAASQDIFAVGAVQFTSEPKENDEVTLRIGPEGAGKEYKYKAKKDDKVAQVIRGLVEAVNGGMGDPLAFASPNIITNQLILTAKTSGDAGNTVEWAVSFSQGAQISGPASGTLSGGQDAAMIAPGSVVLVLGDNLSDSTASSPLDREWPRTLANTEVYIDGIAAPLVYVSPTQINAQMPWEVNDTSSVNAYVRTIGKDGKERVTTAIAVPIIPQNPGIFAEQGQDPRPAVALHESNNATGVVSVDGSPKENDVATVTIEDRTYSYTVKKDETLENVRDALVGLINEDPKVTAQGSGVYTRIVLRARERGPEGEGITYGASASTNAGVIMTALTPALCCANQEGAPITLANPAKPGQTIIVYATGLGFVQPDEAKYSLETGKPYSGPVFNRPNSFIDAIAGGKTANVLFAGLKAGTVGVYELHLQLNSDIPTNPQTQMTIAQDVFVSNIVTFPVVNPNEEPVP